VIQPKDIPTTEVSWGRAARIIPSRFPPVGLFDRVSDPKELESVFAIEAMTNSRLEEEWGDLSLVPAEERVSGPGTTSIMAAFTHPNPQGTRFSTSEFGVYYAANDLDTAIKETVYHRERFLKSFNCKPLEIDMRVYYTAVKADLYDLREIRESSPWIYDPDPRHYPRTQALAVMLRKCGAHGLVYSSVRNPGADCIAIFRPSILEPCHQGEHLTYRWNGMHITDVYKKENYKPVSDVA